MVLPRFVVGHVIRTANSRELGDAGLIPGLWSRTLADASLLALPARVGTELYAALFDYEPGEDIRYSQVVGVGVDTLEGLPPGFAIVAPGDEERVCYDAAGPQPAALIGAWGRVWADSGSGALSRRFTVDIERHGPGGQAEILIAGTRS